MKKCKKCKKALSSEKSGFCPYCGEIFDKKVRLKKEAETAFSFDDIQNNKVFAALSYVGILVIVPFVFANRSEFAMFHAKQGLVIYVIRLILSILASAVTLMLIPWRLDFLSRIFKILFGVVFLISAVGFVLALKGKTGKIPLTDKILNKFNI